MYKSNDKKGFTLIEILASIAILAVVILLVTISYSKIRKNTLNKQYDNLRTLIEQVSIKYAAKTGSYNFFVQDLINEDYLEPDDDDKIYDPRNKTPLNCHLVTISDEEPISATLHEEDHTTNGLCDSSDVDGYSSLLTLSAKLANSNTVYTPTSTVNSSSVYPLIYDGWTKSNLDITADLSQITDSLDYSHIVWNNIPENITYYPDVTFTTDESLIYDDFYYADLYLSNDQRYQARIKYKMDNEKPVIYHDKTTMSKYTKADEWVKSRVIIMYATDKDGVGLDRVYIGPRSCSDLLTDSSMGQAAVPGLVQTYTYTGEVGEAGINANVCAVDKLGNLADSGTIFVSKIDSLPPNVVANTYLYNQTNNENPDLYTTGSLGQVTNADINVASYHSSSDGWTNVGHFYKFSVTDGGSGLPAGDVAIFYSNIWGSYSLINVLSYVSPLTPSSSSTNTTKIYGASIHGKGLRIGKFYVCDKLDNCRTINVTNEKIDKDKPSTPSMNFVYKSWTAYTSNTWTNQDLYAARSKGTAADNAPSSTDQGSGVLKYQIKYPDNPNGTKDYIDYSYNKNDSMYFMNTQGTTSRVFRAIDKAGNISEETTVIGKIDKTGPTNVSAKLRNSNSSGTERTNSTTWTQGPVFFGNFSGTDNLSGINRYEYSDGCTGSKSGDLNTNGHIYGGDNASYSGFKNVANKDFCIRAVDNVGNASDWTSPYYIRVDRVKPTLSYTFVRFNGETYTGSWVNDGFRVTMNYSDADSGINTSTGGWHDNTFSDWRSPSGTVSTTSFYDNWSGEGSRTGYERICDNAGNCSEISFSSKIDLTPPTVYITDYGYNADDPNKVGSLWWKPDSNGANTYSGPNGLHFYNVISGKNPLTDYITFKITASDSGSGYDNYIQWYRDRQYVDHIYNAWPTVLTGNDSGEFTGTYYNNFNVPGCRMAQVIVCDKVGNCTSVDIKAKIKKNGVNPTCDVPGIPEGSTSGGNSTGNNTGGGGNSSICNLPATLTTASFKPNKNGVSCSKGIGNLRDYGANRKFGCASSSKTELCNGNYVEAAKRGTACTSYNGSYTITGTKPKVLYHDYIDNVDYYDKLMASPQNPKSCSTSGGTLYYFSNKESYAWGVRYIYEDGKTKQVKCNGYRTGSQYAQTLGTAYGSGDAYFCCE